MKVPDYPGDSMILMSSNTPCCLHQPVLTLLIANENHNLYNPIILMTTSNTNLLKNCF